MRIDPESPVPIWRQIEDGVRMQVATGGLPAGSPVPSVRALATELVVNPATVAKAYQALADAGVLVVRRGEGTFVADRPPSVSRGERARLLREAAQRFAGVAASAGASPEEALAEARDALYPDARASAGGRR